MLVHISTKQTEGPEKNWSRVGVSLYWQSVEKQSLCCDKGILIFSTRKTSLVIKIRVQRKNYSVAEKHIIPFSTVFLPFFLYLYSQTYFGKAQV